MPIIDKYLIDFRIKIGYAVRESKSASRVIFRRFAVFPAVGFFTAHTAESSSERLNLAGIAKTVARTGC